MTVRRLFSLENLILTVLWLALASAVIVVCSGCSSIRGVPRPQAGGGSQVSIPPARTGATNATLLKLSGPDNPSSASHQSFDRTTTDSQVTPPRIVSEPVLLVSGTNVVITNRTTIYPAATNVIITVERQVTDLGTVQPDTARAAWGAVAALQSKLSAARPVQVLGVLLVLASLAMFHPAVRVFVASQTLQVATAVAGLALIFGPMLVIGNEATFNIAGLVALGALGLWYFVHRHGEARGEINALRVLIPEAESKTTTTTTTTTPPPQ